MIKRLRKRIKGEEGQSLVEFTLVIPILLLLLLGIIEFGHIFYAYLLIENASRDGARYGSVWATDTEIRQIIDEKTYSLEPTNLVVTISPAYEYRQRGEKVEVKIDYKVPLWGPIWGELLPNPFPITAKTVMRVE
ncbi:TadE/TadG family type IV pilus assembly protein [Tepidibacillus fermentans]|uniref:TadE-like protein n=1 Tax=Tepidibacillus fermentans TaxID=1281767 RepID=A0A4R3KJ28_9BACI|nr:TadE/TadG family type IV pilus assembly protein [Tepidibacillus fermentans]TCS83337.1 TadE-like protein [Tepidibacillus fermentans]